MDCENVGTEVSQTRGARGALERGSAGESETQHPNTSQGWHQRMVRQGRRRYPGGSAMDTGYCAATVLWRRGDV